MKKIYTVKAYKWGDRDGYSYLVGVYGSKKSALNAAKNEEEYRGRKYECEVLEWILNIGIRDKKEDTDAFKVIKELKFGLLI